MSSSVPRPGFTLIELLVASMLAIALLGLVVGTMTNLSRLSVRTASLLTMHDAVSGVYRTLSERLSSVHPGCAWHCEASPGADGVWGTGDETVTVTWMASIPFRNEVNYGFSGSDQYDLTWFRLEWRGASHPLGPGLFMSRTRGSKGNISPWSDPVYPTKVYYYFSTWPQPRRDRRRSLDDNDFRTIEGMTPALYADLGGRIPSDGDDLSNRLVGLLNSSFVIEDFRLGWIERNGDHVDFDPQVGLTRTTASGAALPFLGTAWNSGTHLVEDGLFLDARPHALAPDTRDIASARPTLFRLRFTISMEPSSILAQARKAVSQQFSLSIPLGTTLPQP